MHYYEEEHQNLLYRIQDAIKEFEIVTGGKVVAIRRSQDQWEVRTTLTIPKPYQEMRRDQIQQRLDFLDEEIDTLRVEKEAQGDHDNSVIREAQEIQQRAREFFSQGDLERAKYGVFKAEAILMVRRDGLANLKLIAEALGIAPPQAKNG